MKKVEDDDFLVRGARAVAYLTREREDELTDRWCNGRDEAARASLVEAHMRISVAMARKFGRYGLPFADLVQEGNIGLMEAAERFDVSHGVRFSTYATWWVRSAMQEYTIRNWSVVKSSSSSQQKKLFFGLRAIRARIEVRQGKDATPTSVNLAIAEEMGVTLDAVTFATGRLASDASLNAPLGDGEGSMEVVDTIADGGKLPDAIAEESIDGERYRVSLEAALLSLTTRERAVIERRKLCDDEDRETLEGLSDTFGVTRERIRQIEGVALRKLQAVLMRTPGLIAGH